MLYLFSIVFFGDKLSSNDIRGRRGRDRMVVRFLTACAISAYHHYCCEFEPHSWRGVLDTTLCDKVCQWLAAGRWFPPGIPVSFNKTGRNDVTEILLKVVLNTINPNPLTTSSLGLCQGSYLQSTNHQWAYWYLKM